MSETEKYGKRTFYFEFEDESAAVSNRKHDRITHECSAAGGERLQFAVIEGAPTLLGNSAALLTSGKILVKIAMSKYKDGFHVHLHQDFDPDLPEILTIGLSGSIGQEIGR
jgi:hypothetical protein